MLSPTERRRRREHTMNSEIERLFGMFISAIGGTIGTREGQYRLDHYKGGYRVVKMREHGGEETIFGAKRRTKAEMIGALDFALYALTERK